MCGPSALAIQSGYVGSGEELGGRCQKGIGKNWISPPVGILDARHFIGAKTWVVDFNKAWGIIGSPRPLAFKTQDTFLGQDRGGCFQQGMANISFSPAIDL